MFSAIFDMDGTLLDTQRPVIFAWDYAGEQQGYENVGKDIPAVCGMGEQGWSRYLMDRYPELDFEKFKEDVRSFYDENREIKPMKGMFELLDFLKENGVQMAVASGSTTKSIIHHMNAVNAADYFKAMVGSELVPKGKPDPDIFLLAAERLGANPLDCVVFEDSKNGVLAGHAAGMKVVGIPDVAVFSEEIKQKLFCEVSSLDEAIDVLKELL